MTEEEHILYSVIIPVKEINAYVKENVEKIQSENRMDVEIIVLPNTQSPDITGVKIIGTDKVAPGRKRDIGASKARGEWLIFLDDDSYPEKQYFTKLDELIAYNNYSAYGGPGITPESNGFWQQVSGAVFISRWSGGAPERYLSYPGIRLVDDWPSVNFVVNKKIFTEIGGFNTDYWPGEDTVLCEKLKKLNYPILYSEELIVWHHRRNGLLGHMKQVGNYGLHRGHFFRINLSNSRKLRYFIPSVFVMTVTYGLIQLAYGLWNIYSSLILLVYLAVLGLAIRDIVRIKNIKVALCSFPYIIFTHLSYGVMFAIGLTKINLKSRLR